MEEKVDIKYIILAVVVYYISSIYAFMPLIKFWQKTRNNITGNTPSAGSFIPMYRKPVLCYQALFREHTFFPWLIFSTCILGILVILIIVIKETNPDQNGVTYLKNNGTKGTASWMTVSEAKEVINVGENEGIIFGMIKKKLVTMPNQTYNFNKNVAVFGSSGSGKSRKYIRTNCLQMAAEGHSMIFTDPKGELFRDLAPFLRKMGYAVKCFNLVNMTHSDRWNPLAEIKDDIAAQTFAEVVIANTKAVGSKGGDPFWDRAEQNLLKALVLYVITEYPDQDKNLASVYSLIACEEPKKIDTTFERLPNKHPAKMPYNIYAQASETVRTGVVIGLGTRLQVFQNALVQKLTETSDINLILPGKQKCAYFCISSDMDSTFDFLAGLFFSFLFIDLIRYADMNATGRCDIDVNFMLDEFPNIGAIPSFEKKISTMRSRGLNSHVIFQNIAQLKNRYPNDAWQEIIGNCDSRLFLGCNDSVTAKFVSELLGTATVEAVSTTKEGGFEGVFDFGKITRNSSERNLMNPNELLTLKNNNAILILRGQQPLMLNKMDYTKHKLAKQIKPQPISEYNPQWVIDMNKPAAPINIKEQQLEGSVIESNEISGPAVNEDSVLETVITKQAEPKKSDGFWG